MQQKQLNNLKAIKTKSNKLNKLIVNNAQYKKDIKNILLQINIS